MTKYVMEMKTSGNSKTGTIVMSEVETSLKYPDNVNGEALLQETLGDILKKSMDKDKRLYADLVGEQFNGENDTEKLLSCLLQQVDSFWAMFYCEFWFIFNFVLRNAGVLFPETKGFTWAKTANVPINIMVAEDTDKSTHSFKDMCATLRNYIACIVKVTPCLNRPVGLQHLFMVNLVCIQSATKAICEKFCSKSSWLGGCVDTCGGEITSIGKDQEVRRFLKLSKFSGSKGGSSSGPGHMKDTTTYSWMVIRDKIISLSSIVDDAMFVTTMFTNLACGIFGELKVYEPEQLDREQAKDPIGWGVSLREDPTPNPVLTKLSMPFDYVGFALNMACHTGNQVASYLPPIRAYKNDLEIAKKRGVSETFFHKAWCNSMGLFDRDIMTDIMDRLLKEDGVYPLPSVTQETLICTDPNMIGLSDLSSIYYRVALNNHHHLTENTHKHLSKKFVQEMNPDLPRHGIDDYHRNSATPKGNSLVINWTKHIFHAFPGKRAILLRFVMKAAGSYMQEGIEEIISAEKAKNELLEMEDKGKKKKKGGKKKKKADKNTTTSKDQKEIECKETTVSDEEESVASQPKSVTDEEESVASHPKNVSRPHFFDKILKEGAALVICREMKKFHYRRVQTRVCAAGVINRWYKNTKSNTLTRKFQGFVKGLCDSIRECKSEKGTIIARWYRRIYKQWASKRQIVVFDPNTYVRYLREHERRLNQSMYQFMAQVNEYNHRVANFNMTVKMHQIMCQVEHYMVHTDDEFVENNLCPETLSLSVMALSNFPKLKRMIEGFDIGIIAASCKNSMSLKVVANRNGELAIRNIYR